MKRRTAFSLEALEGRSLLSGLATSVTTDGSNYHVGQPVVMTFQETNTSNAPTSVTDGPSMDGFDVMQAGHVVWRSNGGINPLFIQVVPLGPGQSLTLTATWNGIPQGGSSPVSGTFEIVNQLDPHGASATITIGGSASTPSSSPHSPVAGPPGDPSPSPLPPASPSPAGPPPGGPVGPGPITVASGSADPPSPVAGVTVKTNRPAYRVGHPIHMTMIVHGSGRKPHAMALDRLAGGFEVLDGTTVVWSSAARRPPRAGKVRLSAVWNGRDGQTGTPAAPGTYTILAHDGNVSGSTTIRIRG